MGSEGPATITIHVTGFKKFHGVSENPTETIVSNLTDYVKKNGSPKGLVIGSCSILETAGQGAVLPLYQTLQSAISEKDATSSSRIIWVHFGVNSGATKFAIEHQAVNEATFRCPDEMGWKPQKVPIIPSDGGISHIRETSLPVEEITKALAKKGFEVMTSDDAGRFVCNYVYYHSLRFSEQNGIKSLFVHVPLFVTIDEDTQMKFAASLLEEKNLMLRAARILLKIIFAVNMRGIPFSSYSLDDPKSLVKANIHLKGHQSGNRVPVDRALLAEISGVQHVSIPAPCLEVCDLPAFGHLKKLKLNDWELLAINFLNVSPNLEDLVLEGTKSDEECIELQWNLPETVPVCLSSHLKTICIIGFKGWKFEMEAAKYLLKNGRAFKKMIIYTANDLPSMKANKLPKNFSCFKRPVKWNLSTCDLAVSTFRL